MLRPEAATLLPACGREERQHSTAELPLWERFDAGSLVPTTEKFISIPTSHGRMASDSVLPESRVEATQWTQPVQCLLVATLIKRRFPNRSATNLAAFTHKQVAV
jgi:hypothetical protein